MFVGEFVVFSYKCIIIYGMTVKQRCVKLKVLQVLAEVNARWYFGDGMDVVMCLVEETHQVKPDI